MPEIILIAIIVILAVGIILVWKVRSGNQSSVEMASYTPTPSDSSDFRLTIQDTFSIKGRGLVVVGRVERGVITSGQRVQIASPDGTQHFESVVAGLESFPRPIKSASTGENVGILFRDLSKDEVKPGMIITSAPGQ